MWGRDRFGERPRGMRVPGTKYTQIERGACEVRNLVFPELGLDAGLDAVELFERLAELGTVGVPGVGERRLVVSVHGLPTHESVPAMTRYEPPTQTFEIQLSNETYLGLEAGTPRDLFTLCHEVGHVWQHGRVLTRMSSMPHTERFMNREEKPHAIFEDAEWQADAFASALIAPAEGVSLVVDHGSFVTWQVLAEHFGLSREAAELRARILRARWDELIPERLF